MQRQSKQGTVRLSSNHFTQLVIISAQRVDGDDHHHHTMIRHAKECCERAIILLLDRTP